MWYCTKAYNLDYLFTQLYVSFLCARNSNEMSRNCMKSDFMEFVGKLSWILKCNITYCRPRTSLSIHFFPSQTTISSSRPQFATVTARYTGVLDMDNLSSFNRIQGWNSVLIFYKCTYWAHFPYLTLLSNICVLIFYVL